jgi:hypothetical protein
MSVKVTSMRTPQRCWPYVQNVLTTYTDMKIASTFLRMEDALIAIGMGIPLNCKR